MGGNHYSFLIEILQEKQNKFDQDYWYGLLKEQRIDGDNMFDSSKANIAADLLDEIDQSGEASSIEYIISADSGQVMLGEMPKFVQSNMME